MRWLRGSALALVLAAACTAAPAAEPTPSPSDRPPSTGPTGEASVTGPTAAASPSSDPARTRFAGRISALPASVRRDMSGKTWEPGCPVALGDLRLLRFNYLGFTGEIKRGRMVVRGDVAADVLGVFRQLFDARFPFKNIDLASRWRPHGPIDTTRSRTAAFDCRPALNPDLTPTGTWSEHSYGLAVDINPLQNPYVAGDGTVLRPAAEAYLDRTQDLPGMIHPDDVVVRAFAAIGWEWGGNWSTKKDYMHFSLNGR